MIQINLLSPSDKNDLKWKKLDNMIRYNFFIIFFIQLFLIAIFFITLQYIHIENEKLSSSMESLRTKSEAKEINLITGQTKKYISKINTYIALEGMHPSWMNVLEDLSAAIPNGIKVNSINIKPLVESSATSSRRSSRTVTKKNYKKLQLIIIGESRTMSDLLKLEDNLKNSEIFSGFTINPANYDTLKFRYDLVMNN